MSERDVCSLVEKEIERAGSLRALSREWGVSPAMLSDLLNGRRGPGPKILGPLGLRRVKAIQFLPEATVPAR